MKTTKRFIRNAFYFLRGYDADRFSAPKFYIRDVEDLRRVSKLDPPVRVIVAREKCRWSAGFKFSSKVHPFIATMRSENIKYLDTFYKNYTPDNIWEMFFIPSGENSSIASFPWKSIKTKSEVREGGGLKDIHGDLWLGPASSEEIKIEFQRCMNCFKSIKNKGYFPQKYGGYPRGYFLIGENDFCFQVEGGQHRMAALAALNWNRFEVMSMNRPIQLVNPSEVDNWPLVKRNYISREDALTIFNIHLTAGTFENQKDILKIN